MTANNDPDSDVDVVNYRDASNNNVDENGIILYLSGGGFRATFFHLGVIWALRTMGLLKHLTHVYSVSGGSIAAAHLAKRFNDYRGDEAQAISAAKELLSVASWDIRGNVIRRWLVICWSIISGFLHLLPYFGKYFRLGRADFLERS